jgi:multiple sugar transport system permease protein
MAQRKSAVARREAVEGYLMAMPWILGFFLFTALPFLASILLSFSEYKIISPPRWVGFDNYKYFFGKDEYILDAFRVTFSYAFVSVPLHIVGGVLLALLLNQEVLGLRIFRTLYYLPAVGGGAASVAILWTVLLNPNFGIFNSILRYFGIKGPNWLGDPRTALLSLIMMSMWSVGGSMILYLANMQSIPTSLYEAAEIDGASAARRFFSITLPMITPTIFFALTTGLIGSFQTFATAYMMTDGGPMRATLFYVLHLYRVAFKYLNMGYASAMAWVLFVVIMIVTLAQVRLANRWVYYEGVSAQ